MVYRQSGATLLHETQSNIIFFLALTLSSVFCSGRCLERWHKYWYRTKCTVHATQLLERKKPPFNNTPNCKWKWKHLQMKWRFYENLITQTTHLDFPWIVADFLNCNSTRFDRNLAVNVSRPKMKKIKRRNGEILSTAERHKQNIWNRQCAKQTMKKKIFS